MGAVISSILVLSGGAFWSLLRSYASSFPHLDQLLALGDGLTKNRTAAIRHKITHSVHVGYFDIGLFLAGLEPLLRRRSSLEIRGLRVLHGLLRELLLTRVIRAVS